MKLNQPPHKHTHLQAAQSHRTKQSLQKSVLLANELNQATTKATEKMPSCQ